jgi:DNA-binding NarL/FixJ family response regulator
MEEQATIKILVTGSEEISDDELLVALGEAGFDARVQPWHAEVPALVESELFDAIVVRLPLPGVGFGVLLSSIRSRSARCRQAGLVILTPENEIGAVEKLIGRGVNRVLRNSSKPSEIVAAIEEVQGAAKRVSIRLPIQLEVTLPAGDSRAYCQTENLSESGMLLRGIQHYPLGTRFSFQLQIPGTDHCLGGIAEVTRTTDAAREQIQGLGARFVEVDSSDRWMLDQFFEDSDELSN